MKCEHPEIVVDLGVKRFLARPGTNAVGIESTIVNLIPTSKIMCEGCGEWVTTAATGTIERRGYASDSDHRA